MRFRLHEVMVRMVKIDPKRLLSWVKKQTKKVDYLATGTSKLGVQVNYQSFLLIPVGESVPRALIILSSNCFLILSCLEKTLHTPVKVKWSIL